MQVAEIFFAQDIVGHMIFDISFGLEIERFKLVVGDLFEISDLEHISSYPEDLRGFEMLCRHMSEASIYTAMHGLLTI